MFKEPRLQSLWFHSQAIWRPSPHTLGSPRPAPAGFRFICSSFLISTSGLSLGSSSETEQSCGGCYIIFFILLKKKLYVNYYCVYDVWAWASTCHSPCAPRSGDNSVELILSSLFKWVLGMQQACMTSTSTHGAISPAHLFIIFRGTSCVST